MNLNTVDINKLPSDIRRQFKTITSFTRRKKDTE